LPVALNCVDAFAQATIALRVHASRCGHAYAQDPDQLLPGLDDHQPQPAPAVVLSTLRPRVRRSEDAEAVFSTSLETASSKVVPTNSGLGAALLSMFNDIVAGNSDNQHRTIENMNMDCTVSSASSDADEATRAATAEAVSDSLLSMAAPSQLQSQEINQSVAISAAAHPSEARRDDTLTTPRRVKQQSQLSASAAPIHPPESDEKVFPAPRRAKTKGKRPKLTKIAREKPPSPSQEITLKFENELEM
jgi:hypothetical protein